MSETTTYQIKELPKELWQRVKRRAAREGHTVKFIVLRFLASYAKNEKL